MAKWRASYLLLVVWTIAARARADAAPLPFQVHALADAQCDAAARFSAKIVQRSRRLRPAQPGESALDFSLELGVSERSLTGLLRVRELDGTVTQRAITGANCDEVLSALALIAAVLVDPNALSEPLPTASSETPSAPAASPSAARARSPRRWSFGAGAGVGLEGAVAPDTLLSASSELDLVLGGDALLGPRFALALHRSFPDQARAAAGVAHFSWTSLRASACPLRIPSAGVFALRPCALFDVGRLTASGDGAYDPKSVSVRWLATGAFARLELRPLPQLELGLDAGLLAPLSRDRFYFDPAIRENTLQASGIGVTLRLGVAATFE